VPLAAAVGARSPTGIASEAYEEPAPTHDAADVRLLSGLSLALIVGGFGGLLMWLALRDTPDIERGQTRLGQEESFFDYWARRRYGGQRSGSAGLAVGGVAAAGALLALGLLMTGNWAL
jgi:hypothetical protein